jgi:hypothetical protein
MKSVAAYSCEKVSDVSNFSGKKCNLYRIGFWPTFFCYDDSGQLGRQPKKSAVMVKIAFLFLIQERKGHFWRKITAH